MEKQTWPCRSSTSSAVPSRWACIRAEPKRCQMRQAKCSSAEVVSVINPDSVLTLFPIAKPNPRQRLEYHPQLFLCWGNLSQAKHGSVWGGLAPGGMGRVEGRGKCFWKCLLQQLDCGNLSIDLEVVSSCKAVDAVHRKGMLCYVISWDSCSWQQYNPFIKLKACSVFSSLTFNLS